MLAINITPGDATRMQARSNPGGSRTTRHGVARVISKLGLASRTQAAQWVRDGRVMVNGKIVREPEFSVRMGLDAVALVDGTPVDGPGLVAAGYRYLALNKPRGLVTTTRDERGRDTVYRCFDGAGLPWVAPAGRLDKASEGLLLLSNDPAWAARLTDPETGPDKTYHVQVDAIPDVDVLAALHSGVQVDGDLLSAKSVRLLRVGGKNAWLEIVLDEGRNRQIRRLLAAFDIAVLRLVRVAIGSIALGELPKGKWRDLDSEEISSLSRPSAAPLS